MADELFDYLPRDEIIRALERSPGNELGSGKFASPESSAALAANTFGLFIKKPDDLPVIPGTDDAGWPANFVSIEQRVRFPWAGGQHPWLDAFVETGTHIIGIESKRYEPFRGKPKVNFSDAYWRDVWGERMRPFEKVRDDLSDSSIVFERLDAAQLVKHGFGLRTESHRRHKLATLVYLYAEPELWPDGKLVNGESKKVHAKEAQYFANLVVDAEVTFTICTYQRLLSALRQSSDAKLQHHADMIQRTFQP